jgi:hypothetical protein
MFTLKILAFVALGILAFLALAYVVMRLWNWLVPGAFNGPRLAYKYALGLLVLCRILFGGFGPRGGYGGHAGRHPGDWHRWERPQPKPTPQPTSSVSLLSSDKP